MNILFFFFSSRRRHTRSLRDWSSDVCSSDLDRLKLVAWNVRGVDHVDDDSDERTPAEPDTHECSALHRESGGHPIIERSIGADRKRDTCNRHRARCRRMNHLQHLVVFEILISRRSKEGQVIGLYGKQKWPTKACG